VLAPCWLAHDDAIVFFFLLNISACFEKVIIGLPRNAFHIARNEFCCDRYSLRKEGEGGREGGESAHHLPTLRLCMKTTLAAVLLYCCTTVP